MKVFTATNGILFTIAEDGVLRWEGGYDPRRVTGALREYFQRERDIALTTANFETLREYFQAERDEALGRWRDPENPNMVCYERGDDTVYVLDERTGFTYARPRSDIIDGSDQYDSVAKRYFEAHPEPKPWDAAQPDEVWVLTINNDREEVFRCGERGLYQLKTGNPLGSLLSCSHNKITAGRRVWPEGDASE